MSDFTDKLRPAEPSGSSILAKERESSSIVVDELACHIYPDDFLERQSRVVSILQQDDVFDKSRQQHISRPDRYKLGLARSKAIRRLVNKHGWTEEDAHMAEYLVDEMAPYHLHMSMFNTTIREQGDDEQQTHWVPLIDSWSIIGSYAQTELGHGSNVRGLETEARWEKRRKQFILHSPTLTASKWWNGSLGRTATHAIVVAQLMLPRKRTGDVSSLPVNDSLGGPSETSISHSSSRDAEQLVSYGPHPFIVQVRDTKTHMPLPGIVVGDIGPKLGYQSMDNAYMLFHDHPVPHSAFLRRYSQVDPETGAYSQPKNAAVVYGSLTMVRTRIVMHARLILARAVTNAVRYLTIRRQFADRDDDRPGPRPEVAVLDYTTVQVRVLPLLATTFALHYTGVAMGEMYASTRKQITSGDFSALADMHATSSGLKSLCTTLAADGIETCRRAMGGHGFHTGSGMVALNADYLSKPTVEGDNWMITQQTASYLIKKVSSVLEDLDKSSVAKTPDATEAALREYLLAERNSSITPFEVLPPSQELGETDAALVEAFSRRAATLAVRAHQSRVVEKASWNSLLLDLHELSNAHSQVMLVRNYYAALKVPEKMPISARPAMLTCYRLFALYTMFSNGLSFVQTRAISLDDVHAIQKYLQKLMADLRLHAVKLVDAWSIPDYLLDSALGRYDGKVYETLFDMAHRRNPLNDFVANPYYWEDEVEMGKGRAKL